MGLKPFGLSPAAQLISHIPLSKLGYAVASLADRKSRCTMSITNIRASRMVAGNESVQALNPMHQTIRNQLVKCPVDLKRRPQTVVAELIKNRVCAQRPICPLKSREYQRLIAREVRVAVWCGVGIHDVKFPRWACVSGL